jgi:two-component system LytT family response regulator
MTGKAPRIQHDVIIRTLIVDDEPLARERVRSLLEREPDVEIVGEAEDGPSAVRALREKKPDLLFLDVQMPGLDGFGVLQKLDPAHVPVTILITAYDRYAIQAFEIHALDYILKPFDRKRFQEAMRRARVQLEQTPSAELSHRMLALIEHVQQRNEFIDRLVVKSGGRVLFIPVSEIDWIEAAGNYVRLHRGQAEHLLRETMSSLEAKLDPKTFLRIHRSTIVNINRIQELQPTFHGDFVVVLKGATQLSLSRNYREAVEERLGTPL